MLDPDPLETTVEFGLMFSEQIIPFVPKTSMRWS